MAYSNSSQGQTVTAKGNPHISAEEFQRQCAKLLTEMTEKIVVSPGTTIRVKEDGGETLIFREGDPLVRAVDIRCGSIWSDLQHHKHLLEATKSQLLVNIDDPSARYIVGDRALSLTGAGRIFDCGEVVCQQDCAHAPDPSARTFSQGTWIEKGDFHSGDDGSETFQRLLDLGRITDRTVVGKVRTAVKRAVTGRSVSK
jgi:hypothetical protein